MAKGKEIVKVTSPQPPAVPQPEPDFVQQLRDKARATKSALTVGVPRIKHKGGVLTIDGARVAGNKLAAIILGMVWAKEYYEEEWEEGSTATPTCYAFGQTERGLVPHAAAPDKQAEACDGCQHNVFGTALQGKGKRCGDKPRLLLLLASDLERLKGEELERGIAKAQHYMISIPITSIAAKGAEGIGLNKYVASLAEHTNYGDLTEAITEITTEPRQQGGYFLTFSFLGKTPGEAMPFLLKRASEAPTVLAQPFPVLSEEAVAPPEKPIKGQGKNAPKGKGRKHEDDIPF